MAQAPLTLGIVTISYNQACHLREAIGSVRLRDPGRLRYVIVDPGSTDGSREIIREHRDRFSALLFEPDRGPADGLNRGFARCPADILGYLNSDDRFAPGAPDFVLDYFERHPEVDVLMGAIRIIDAAGRPARRRRVPWRFSPQDYLDDTALPLQQGTFFRRRAWERTRGFNAENPICWDTELLIDLALAGARLRLINKVLGEFRLYPASLSGTQLLSGDQTLIQQRRREEARLKRKILDAGGVPTPRPRVWLKRLSFHAHPVRRVLEFAVR
jgi:glycosyltransferase involved in cell wall biosynthesis